MTYSTINAFAERSFEDRPCLLSVTPTGERLLWLEQAGDYWLFHDNSTAVAVPNAGDADQLVRDWARDVGGDWSADFAARMYAGAEIGQCSECDAWLIQPDDDLDPPRHEPDCLALLTLDGGQQ